MPWLEFMIVSHCPGFENIDGDEGGFQNDFIHENMQEPGIKVGRWIFTKAQTGKGQLDTHYSFVNTKFRAYIEDGNDITIKEDIFKSFWEQGSKNEPCPPTPPSAIERKV